MKLVSVDAVAAAIGLGLAIAENPMPPHASGTTSYPPGCTVTFNGTPSGLPRAGVTIENRMGRPVHAWIKGRPGLPPIDFGWIGADELRFLAHTLPAGRNLLYAAADNGAAAHVVLTVANRGAATCNRRYLWRIE
jgi:hypothetical protein